MHTVEAGPSPAAFTVYRPYCNHFGLNSGQAARWNYQALGPYLKDIMRIFKLNRRRSTEHGRYKATGTSTDSLKDLKSGEFAVALNE
jgi:hypothetical protein